MATETKQRIEAGTYSVDPVHSHIGFAVVHNGVSTFRSGFSGYQAKLVGGEHPSLTGTVEVDSIDIDEPQLRGHLLSPDFFDVERNPRLEFRSTELVVGEDGSVRIRGELEIGGTVRQVEASGRYADVGADLAGSARVGISLETTVDRREFGLEWNAELPSGGEVLDYDVRIEVGLELVKEDE
ncbi:MAG TPA: YceI family protein [Solirubrobacterales bacterium]|jgi:polyisoprenoid-binding protein YceI